MCRIAKKWDIHILNTYKYPMNSSYATLTEWISFQFFYENPMEKGLINKITQRK